MPKIVTPTVPAPQANSKPASAAALLAGATKRGKATSHVVYTGEAGQEAAARWLELSAKFAETERAGPGPRSGPRRDPPLA